MNAATDPIRRKVLLAVTGLSPQVVTETLYVLAVERNPAWIPDEIFLITTAEGAERARLALLSEAPGWFARLRADYDLPPIAFDAEHIITVPDADGAPLSDIRTPEDNRRVADLITEQVRRLCADDSTELHVSIAGGRKTMGYYLGYALSLFGRPQDRISHVLVSAPFESSWEFFYPTPYSRVISLDQGKRLVDARDARVTLAEIPFVSLREGLPTRLLEGGSSFSDTVAAARRALEPPRLMLDLESGRVEAAGERFTLADADFGLYAWFAHRRQQGDPPIRWSDEVDTQDFLSLYEQRCGVGSQRVETLTRVLRVGIDKEWFEQRRSKTNKAIEQALGPQLARAYLIHSHGRRPNTRYGLDLPPEAIHLHAIEEQDK